ncbi:hypothetical protein A3B36_02900 [Candidatus Uhrbacteria bacterium RIFCSPLOWO2_01_FULL_55_36]|uniref:Bacterial Ig-like domain-containing protein n=1 Tax=Candidatus Uhrbacteria bacterium RIFCSPLOWO2_01_FULL_55_36 TaxID=1802404 RepID=A0A1F7V0L0_9BACT|nr:MAG: hypothetical protein A3B36_02900 [Candidatus Uhrbacteria bacterium RIFCSPLOWO2_01_FULL_55_36]
MSLTIVRALAMRVRTFGIALAIVLLALGPAAQAATVAEPVFDAPRYGDMQLDALPAFVGRAGADSELAIAIDGERMGKAQYSTTSTTEAPFAFTPAEPLQPGYHYVEAFASDPTGEKEARQSLWWLFHVRDALPAPILRRTIERAGGSLVVIGVVQSGNRVLVYLDGNAAVLSAAYIHASGTASFAITLPSVSVGAHTIALSLVRPDGTEGTRSEPYPVTVTGAATPSPKPEKPYQPVALAPVTRPSQEVESPQASQAQEIEREEVMPQPVPAMEPEAVSPKPDVVIQESGDAQSVVIVPAQGPLETATRAAPQTEAAAPTSKSRGQLVALVVLGLLLVALIIWYATRKDGDDREGGMPSPTAPRAPSSGEGAVSAPSAPEEPEDDIPFPPHPPPPAPNFASRTDQY